MSSRSKEKLNYCIYILLIWWLIENPWFTSPVFLVLFTMVVLDVNIGSIFKYSHMAMSFVIPLGHVESKGVPRRYKVIVLGRQTKVTAILGTAESLSSHYNFSLDTRFSFFRGVSFLEKSEAQLHIMYLLSVKKLQCLSVDWNPVIFVSQQSKLHRLRLFIFCSHLW